MFEPTKKKFMRCCAPDTRQGTIRATSREWPTTRPEPHLYASQNSVCAGIVARAALFSEGGWDAFSKTPTASNPVICFRVELHLGAEPTRHSGADSLTGKALCSPCGGRCSRWERWGNGNGKSDGNRRILLPSSRHESAGGVGTSNIWGSRSRHRATRIPFGSKRPDPPFSILNRRQATFSREPTRSGC
jgi:hypothetical protein